jgi:hypothetical protein
MMLDKNVHTVFVQSLEKASLILRQLIHSKAIWGVREQALELAMPRSSVHEGRMCACFVHEHQVFRVERSDHLEPDQACYFVTFGRLKRFLTMNVHLTGMVAFFATDVQSCQSPLHGRNADFNARGFIPKMAVLVKDCVVVGLNLSVQSRGFLVTDFPWVRRIFGWFEITKVTIKL